MVYRASRPEGDKMSSSTFGQDWVEKMNVLGAKQEPFLFLIDFVGEKGVIVPLTELEDSSIQYKFSASPSNSRAKEDRPLELSVKSESFEDYRKGFELVQDRIRRGDSYLTNYTTSTPIELSGSLIDVFDMVEAKYKVFYKDEWVCFSPESFVQINAQGQISTFPMKGTVDGRIPSAREELKNNSKELAEHYTIVDLLRNDLSKVAKRVRVKRFMYIEDVVSLDAHLLQASSEISGQLPEGWHQQLGDLFKALLPAGSVSGAPKRETMNVIREAEVHERGFYCGVTGVYDGRAVDSGVLIRFIEKTDQGYVYKSGGGITSRSQLSDEYNEMLQKIYLPIS